MHHFTVSTEYLFGASKLPEIFVLNLLHLFSRHFNFAIWGWSYFETLNFHDFVKFVETESLYFRDFVDKSIVKNLHYLTLKRK